LLLARRSSLADSTSIHRIPFDNTTLILCTLKPFLSHPRQSSSIHIDSRTTTLSLAQPCSTSITSHAFHTHPTSSFIAHFSYILAQPRSFHAQPRSSSLILAQPRPGLLISIHFSLILTHARSASLSLAQPRSLVARFSHNLAHPRSLRGTCANGLVPRMYFGC
jgi:hypothetical protein